MTDDLLSRLSAATEGSAELDRDVLLACGWTRTAETRWRPAHLDDWIDPAGREVAFGFQPLPTRSLDDITRMIKEAGIVIHGYDAGYKPVRGWVLNGNIAHGATPALALVIAFLRARETGR